VRSRRSIRRLVHVGEWGIEHLDFILTSLKIARTKSGFLIVTFVHSPIGPDS
jgi:hypothetical protein